MTPLTYLDVGSGNSQNFLRAWQAWRVDLQRARMLHFVAICSGDFDNSAPDADLEPLVALLDTQLWGLLPGFHRLAFEGGQVLLTVCVGDIAKVLRQQHFKAEVVYLNTTQMPSADWAHVAKAIARLCKPGARLTTSVTSDSRALQAAFQPCGFVFEPSPNEMRATYNPAWVTRKRMLSVQPSTCVVIGAGLAGAAVASSLARRGWAVTVLDAANEPASGASSLPAGLLVPHTSPDDSPLSRLSRSGIRMTLQQARGHLRHGTDWGHTGVLQRRLNGDLQPLPPEWAQSQWRASSDWCHSATARTLAAAGLPADAPATWHAQAGWVKPAALVHAWLAMPNIAWRGGVKVTRIAAAGTGWQLLDEAGSVVATADLVVVSAGYASGALAANAEKSQPQIQLKLQPVRGQVTTGLQKISDTLPPFAVNGHGGLIPGITTPEGAMWLMGAGYERDVDLPDIKDQDHADNFERLQTLLPHTALALTAQFNPQQSQGWAGIRCTTPNRLPLVKKLSQPPALPGLWVCTGMGSRGLSFAALCGELLAAQLHGEPLPVEGRLAKAMGMAT